MSKNEYGRYLQRLLDGELTDRTGTAGGRTRHYSAMRPLGDRVTRRSG